MIFDEPLTKDNGLKTRMKTIIDLNDRRNRYLVERNRAALIALADEYRARGMTNTAKEVLKEADQL
jgi:hypothetical protein